MNGKTHKPAGHLCYALIIISWLFLWGCTTPETTPDKIGPKTPVLETIQLDPEGDTSVISITSSTETTFSPFFTLSSPPRICVDVKGIPSSSFTRTIRPESGAVRNVTVQDRGSGYTGIVIYLREEGSECTVTAEGIITRIVIGPAKAAEQATTREVSPASKTPFLPQILNVEVSEPKKNRTRLAIFSEKELAYQPKLAGKTLFLDFKDITISPSLTKKIHAKTFEGAVERIKVVHPEGSLDVTPHHHTQGAVSLSHQQERNDPVCGFFFFFQKAQGAHRNQRRQKLPGR